MTSFGGPEVLEMREVPMPSPSENEFLVAVQHAGVNYADTHQVENSYLSPTQLPFIPGSEVAGVDSEGNRWVGFTTSGGYAEHALLSRKSAVRIPEGVTNEEALACLVQGLTAWHLLKTSVRLAKGESMLVHAAAGGVGNLLMQLGKVFEAGQIIGAVSTVEKQRLLTEMGFDSCFVCTPNNLVTEIRRLTNGRGVDTCFEMVGGEIGDQSLQALAPFGRLAVYGMASRVPMKDVSPASLMYGSRAIVGFWLLDLIVNRPAELASSLLELLTLVGRGAIKPITGAVYPFADVKLAHTALRGRSTTGKVTLRVSP